MMDPEINVSCTIGELGHTRFYACHINSHFYDSTTLFSGLKSRGKLILVSSMMKGN